MTHLSRSDSWEFSDKGLIAVAVRIVCDMPVGKAYTYHLNLAAKTCTGAFFVADNPQKSDIDVEVRSDK